MPGWIARSLVLTCLTILGFAAGPSSEHPLATDSRALTSERRLDRSLDARRLEIASYRRLTWGCQDRLGESRTRPAVSVWSLSQSLGRRTWVRDAWKERYQGCRTRLAARTIPPTHDWFMATRLAERIYPGTQRWLLSCSSGEGGHGGFVMNHQGSGAGGPLQFMRSTFDAHVTEAFGDARDRGFFISRAYESWYHPLGQAITGAFMRTHGMSSHWDPGIDPLCR